MSWEAIGAIGDIGGAVAVIATLFFLYKQIRLNTRELERANLHQSAQSTMSNNALYVQIWQPLLQDKELADIYLRAIKGEALSEIDSFRFSVYINTVFALGEAAYFQTASGVGFDELSDDATEVIDVFSGYMCKLLKQRQEKTGLNLTHPRFIPRSFCQWSAIHERRLNQFEDNYSG